MEELEVIEGVNQDVNNPVLPQTVNVPSPIQLSPLAPVTTQPAQNNNVPTERAIQDIFAQAANKARRTEEKALSVYNVNPRYAGLTVSPTMLENNQLLEQAAASTQDWFDDVWRDSKVTAVNFAGTFVGGFTSIADMLQEQSFFPSEGSLTAEIARNVNDYAEENAVFESTYDIENPIKSVILPSLFTGSSKGYGEIVKSLGFAAGAVSSVAVQEAIVGTLTAGIGSIPVLANGAKLLLNAPYLVKTASSVKNAANTAIQTNRLLEASQVMKGLGFTGANLRRSILGKLAESEFEAADSRSSLLFNFQQDYYNRTGTLAEGAELDRMKEIADQAHNTRYLLNMSTALLDVPFNSAIFKGFDDVVKLNEKLANSGYKATLDKLTNKITIDNKYKFQSDIWQKNTVGKTIANIGEKGKKGIYKILQGKTITWNEGVEEGYQYLLGESTNNYYTELFENNEKIESDLLRNVYEVGNRMWQDKALLSSVEGTQNILLGLLGGTGQNLMSKVVQAYKKSSKSENFGKDFWKNLTTGDDITKPEIEEAEKTLNKFFNESINKLGISSSPESKVQSTVMTENIRRKMDTVNNPLTHLKLQKKAIFTSYSEYAEKGMTDTILKILDEQIKGLSVQDFNQLTGSNLETEQQKQAKIQQIKTDIKQVQSAFDTVNANYRNRYVESTDADSPYSKFNELKKVIAYHKYMTDNLVSSYEGTLNNLTSTQQIYIDAVLNNPNDVIQSINTDIESRRALQSPEQNIIIKRYEELKKNIIELNKAIKEESSDATKKANSFFNTLFDTKRKDYTNETSALFSLKELQEGFELHGDTYNFLSKKLKSDDFDTALYIYFGGVQDYLKRYDLFNQNIESTLKPEEAINAVTEEEPPPVPETPPVPVTTVVPDLLSLKFDAFKTLNNQKVQIDGREYTAIGKKGTTIEFIDKDGNKIKRTFNNNTWEVPKEAKPITTTSELKKEIKGGKSLAIIDVLKDSTKLEDRDDITTHNFASKYELNLQDVENRNYRENEENIKALELLSYENLEFDVVDFYDENFAENEIHYPFPIEMFLGVKNTKGLNKLITIGNDTYYGFKRADLFILHPDFKAYFNLPKDSNFYEDLKTIISQGKQQIFTDRFFIGQKSQYNFNEQFLPYIQFTEVVEKLFASNPTKLTSNQIKAFFEFKPYAKVNEDKNTKPIKELYTKIGEYDYVYYDSKQGAVYGVKGNEAVEIENTFIDLSKFDIKTRYNLIYPTTKLNGEESYAIKFLKQPKDGKDDLFALIESMPQSTKEEQFALYDAIREQFFFNVKIPEGKSLDFYLKDGIISGYVDKNTYVTINTKTKKVELKGQKVEKEYNDVAYSNIPVDELVPDTYPLYNVIAFPKQQEEIIIEQEPVISFNPADFTNDSEEGSYFTEEEEIIEATGISPTPSEVSLSELTGETPIEENLPEPVESADNNLPENFNNMVGKEHIIKNSKVLITEELINDLFTKEEIDKYSNLDNSKLTRVVVTKLNKLPNLPSQSINPVNLHLDDTVQNLINNCNGLS